MAEPLDFDTARLLNELKPIYDNIIDSIKERFKFEPVSIVNGTFDTIIVGAEQGKIQRRFSISEVIAQFNVNGISKINCIDFTAEFIVQKIYEALDRKDVYVSFLTETAQKEYDSLVSMAELRKCKNYEETRINNVLREVEYIAYSESSNSDIMAAFDKLRQLISILAECKHVDASTINAARDQGIKLTTILRDKLNGIDTKCRDTKRRKSLRRLGD